MVKSISWPIAETMGICEPAMALASLSSLKVHRSSREPPPRQITITSFCPLSLQRVMASMISSMAPLPWTLTGIISMGTAANLFSAMERKSCTAAPLGEVIRAIFSGSNGRGLLRSSPKNPSAANLRLRRSKASCKAPAPFVARTSTMSWYSPRASYSEIRPRQTTSMPSFGVQGR